MKFTDLQTSEIHSALLLAWQELQRRVELNIITELDRELHGKLDQILSSSIKSMG